MGRTLFESAPFLFALLESVLRGRSGGSVVIGDCECRMRADDKKRQQGGDDNAYDDEKQDRIGVACVLARM